MVYKIILGRNESDRKKYGERGALLIGKQYITMGKNVSLANQILLDVARPHVILVSGKRGSGKCLHGSTLITLSDGSVKRIEDLANDDNDILSLDNKLKITRQMKKGFYKRKVNKLLYLKFRSGRELKLTPEHPLLTIKGWVEAKNLGTGNRVAAPRVLNVFGNEELEDYKVKLLAYLLAEGHLSNFDKALVDDFKKSVKQFSSNLQVKQHSSRDYYVVYEKSSLTKWLIELGIYNKLSAEKFIPQLIFKLPRHQLALFLNRLFSCDGSIYKHKAGKKSVWKISYSSSSRVLIRQVQHLLLRFGILSRLRTKKSSNYELVINRINMLKFLKEIGFYGKKEKSGVQAINESLGIKSNPNVDTIPKDVWDIYRPDNWVEVGRAFNYKNPKALRSSINYGPSRQKLAQMALVSNNESMYLLATSDIFWDEVVDVEELTGNFDVYDIAVPGCHNFVANDIIVHNSYTLGVITEAMANMPPDVSRNLAAVIFDTMGIFWTMKFPNYRDEEIMSEWEGVEPKGFADSVTIYVPQGLYEKFVSKGIPVDKPFSISCKEISSFEWCSLFNVSVTGLLGILITRVITKLLESGKDYGVDDIIKAVMADKKADAREKEAVVNMFENVKSWGLFSREGVSTRELLQRGKTTIIDLSGYAHIMGGFSIRALVIGLISKKILEERITSRKIEELRLVKKGYRAFGEWENEEDVIPQVWLFIDEAHEFLPREGSTLASNSLIEIIREGRQPGVSLVLATQQPGKIHSDVITQADIVLSHRLTARIDIQSLNQVMQTYLAGDIQKYLDALPKRRGAAIILDDKLERMYPVQIRPRMSWHGGAEPEVIPPEKKNETKSFK